MPRCAAAKEQRRERVMMKKMMAALLAVFAMFTLAACGSAQTKTVDAQALADALVQGVKFDGAMSAMSADELRFSLAEMPDCTAAAYKSDGTTKEIVVVAQCADSAAAATMKTSLETYLAEQKDEASKYQPEELQRLDSAVLQTVGTCVVLCVSADSDAAAALIRENTK